MQKVFPILAISITLLSIVLVTIKTNIQNKKVNELATLLMQGKYDEFDKLIDSNNYKNKLPILNYFYLKLNKAIILKNAASIEEILNDNNLDKLSNKEKDILYKRAFYYYLNEKDKNKTQKYYELIKQLNRNDFITIDRLYDTYINNGYKYLDDTLKQLSLAKDDNTKAQLELLLSNMYANKKDKDNVEKYLNLAQSHLNKGINK
jgi:hypothetical protein